MNTHMAQDLPEISLLLRARADPNSPGADGETVLFEAEAKLDRRGSMYLKNLDRRGCHVKNLDRRESLFTWSHPACI